MTGNKSFIYKDRAGQSWFLGIYSNNYEDREGEIITWEAHLEYAKWVKEAGVKFPVTPLHQPKLPVEVHLAQFIGLANGTFTAEEFSNNYMKMYAPFAIAQTETIIPINGFMIVVAKILKNKEDVAQLLAKSDWGMSHGFLSFDRDDTTINHYRAFEFTTLPSVWAANILTASSVKEIKRKMDNTKGLSDADKEVLSALLESKPEDLEEATLAMQGVLKKVLDNKEIEQEEEVAVEEDVVTDEYTELRNKIFADLDVEQLQKAFSAITETLQKVEQRLDGFEGRIKQTERSEDERIAESFMKPNWDLLGKSVTETDEEFDVESLKEKALGDKPIEGVKSNGHSDNPLVVGMWNPMGLGEQK